MPRSRRALLQTAGLALGAGALGGCLGNPTGTGDADPDETPTPSPTPTPNDTSTEPAFATVKQWLPDPTKTPVRDGATVEFYDVASIRDREAAFHENAYERLDQQLRRVLPVKKLLDIETVEAAFNIDHYTDVAFGSFDPAAFGEQIYAPKSDGYRGFELYADRAVYAVSEDAVLSVMPSGYEEKAPERARAVIDTQADDTSTYADGNDYVGAMLSLVDDAHALLCYPDPMDGSGPSGFREADKRGKLQSWTFGSETTHLMYAYSYVDADAAANADLEGYIESHDDRFGPYDGLDVETEGLVTWTEGTIPTDEFDNLTPGGPDDGVHTAN